MGFSGGGSNILKPHKHNSLVLQDGGNLDFKNDTQSDMSASSMTYSNGSHLQELGIGSTGQHLGIAGGIPAWTSTFTTLTTQQSIQSGMTTTASATFVAVGNGMRLTLPTRAGGKALVCCNYTIKNSAAGNSSYVSLFDDGVSNAVVQSYYSQSTPNDNQGSIQGVFDLDGSVIELYTKCNGGSVSIAWYAGAILGSICSLEIS